MMFGILNIITCVFFSVVWFLSFWAMAKDVFILSGLSTGITSPDWSWLPGPRLENLTKFIRPRSVFRNITVTWQRFGETAKTTFVWLRNVSILNHATTSTTCFSSKFCFWVRGARWIQKETRDTEQEISMLQQNKVWKFNERLTRCEWKVEHSTQTSVMWVQWILVNSSI